MANSSQLTINKLSGAVAAIYFNSSGIALAQEAIDGKILANREFGSDVPFEPSQDTSQEEQDMATVMTSSASAATAGPAELQAAPRRQRCPSGQVLVKDRTTDRWVCAKLT